MSQSKERRGKRLSTAEKKKKKKKKGPKRGEGNWGTGLQIKSQRIKTVDPVQANKRLAQGSQQGGDSLGQGFN